MEQRGGGGAVMEEVGRLVESLGLADVPILSGENRALCGDLASLRLEAHRLAAEVDREGDEAQLIYAHRDEVEAAAGTARALAASRREEARAEADLGKIARMERERVRRTASFLNQ